MPNCNPTNSVITLNSIYTAAQRSADTTDKVQVNLKHKLSQTTKIGQS